MLSLAFPLLGHAQEQEQRLIDRLLRPNIALQSSYQNKQFVAAHSTAVKNRATPTRTFYTGRTLALKEVAGLKTFSTREAVTTAYVGRNRQAAIRDGSALSKNASLATRNTVALRSVPDSDKKIAPTDFAGQRKFLGEGKSQKALDQKNATLTLEQVRELLNKNK